jgi:EAL domain-containing protein (putative c-di-GMP-specific phosphodiesterase class I)
MPPVAAIPALPRPPSPPRPEANAAPPEGWMEGEVRRSLAQGRIGFHFQPVVRAGRPAFAAFHEMLVRMRLPSGQTVSAGAFMPQVEAGPVGRAIDRLAFARAVALLRVNPTLRLSINMSPLSMGDAEWLCLFEQAAVEARAALPRLILEVTESEAIRDVRQTRAFMDHVRTTGVAFAIDDFGAGATGFRHFRDLRFDMVKIDGAFVDGVSRSADAQVLVECLAAVARHFEMMVVAEKVDDPADAAWLEALGVDCLQGYLFARPGPDLTGLADSPLTTCRASA